MKVVVTGCCGFIGSHVSEALLARGDSVVGVDWHVMGRPRKLRNLALLRQYPAFTFLNNDVRTTKIIRDTRPDCVIHLAATTDTIAAQNPELAQSVNVGGFVNLLEQIRQLGTGTFRAPRILFATTAQVYGGGNSIPFSERDPLTPCTNAYACTKVAMEKHALEHAQRHGVRSTALRFFTVFGPRGRVDMAPHIFLSSIANGQPIVKHGAGDSMRDYTYVDDIVRGVLSAADTPQAGSFDVYNLGAGRPVTLNELIHACETTVGRKAIVATGPARPGDVARVSADYSKAKHKFGYEPKVGLKAGLARMYSDIKYEQNQHTTSSWTPLALLAVAVTGAAVFAAKR